MNAGLAENEDKDEVESYVKAMEKLLGRDIQEGGLYRQEREVLTI